ncbi:hypothetical protein E5161_00715 [Cohnella pontilimi]|uniref:Uncharacterized protein n=1 Tax=Cohnella pontilimi TaxID=2564100 RepID=A0A4U0FG33_9BACL|nr:hypothetical protein [Cohnella pontilimi]TJY43956.1 hypothetical protein E5161_00715 [Cohnella pontilimi]
MEIKQLVESIVRELVYTLEAEAVRQQPKVLYVFGDSTAHEAYSDHFILLNIHGIRHDMLLLDGETSGWLGKHKIESGGPGKVIAVDEYAPAPLELPLEYDGIVIPEIDLDNAARSALGIRGTVMSEIIFASLTLNRFVLVGEDVPGLKKADRRTLKTLTLTQPYANLFDSHKRQMASLGVVFAPREKLAEQAASMCGGLSVSGGERPHSRTAEDSLTFNGRLVTEQWVRQQLRTNGSWNRLSVGKGTILSPLAKDLLKEKGIAVHDADER